VAWQGRVLPRVLVPLHPLRAQTPPDLHTSRVTAERRISPGSRSLTRTTCALLQGLNMRDGHKKSAATQAAVFFLLLIFPGIFYSVWSPISVNPQVASRTDCLVRTPTPHLRSAAGRTTFSQDSLLHGNCRDEAACWWTRADACHPNARRRSPGPRGDCRR